MAVDFGGEFLRMGDVEICVMIVVFDKDFEGFANEILVFVEGNFLLEEHRFFATVGFCFFIDLTREIVCRRSFLARIFKDSDVIERDFFYEF